MHRPRLDHRSTGPGTSSAGSSPLVSPPFRPATARPALRGARVIAVLGAALALALAGCSRGDSPEPTAAPTTTTVPAAPAPSVKLTASAQGEGTRGALKQAASKAAPELQTFLTRYVTTAFDPAAAKAGYRGFSRFFTPELRAAVTRDIASLSLGRGGAKLTEVTTKPAGARVVFLIADGRPVAATVRLTVDGTASAGGGETPVGLRADFQLERAGGWRIAAYDSQATVPK